MWVPRTEEEKRQWMTRMHSQATAFALRLFVLGCAGGTAVLYFGIRPAFLPPRHTFMGGLSWSSRLVGCLLLSALASWYGCYDVRRKQIEKELAQTVCPACGTLGQRNHGGPCNCGGTFVKVSEVRWVDDAVEEPG